METIFILSGGLDSTTALYALQSIHNISEALTFDYGQRHRREIASAQKICKVLRLPHRVINIRNLCVLLGGSSLTDVSVKTPHGHYRQATMKQTIVPNRNAIMLNIAAGYAVSKKIYALGLGVHAGDHYIYPDCRQKFITAQARTLSLANECNFTLIAPFLQMDKTAIVKKGNDLGVPFEQTWTCYEGLKRPCSKCGSCLERIEAFAKNGLRDPLYSKTEWIQCLKSLVNT